MNKLFTFLLAAMAFVACTQNDVEELSANREALPETLTVGFEGDDTRVELNEALKTVWTEGDEVSVFYRSYENTRWAFQGETGDRSGELILVSGEVGAQTMDNTIVVYPYSDSYAIDADTHAVAASLPAVQSYKEGSYGAEGNIMVAESKFTQFSLKSVVGWLRVELTGEGEVVESIKVRGNDGEQVAGLCYINAADASIALAESEVDESLVATEVRLDCGSGVTLDAEATEFYVALLPQEFAKGITIEVLFNDGSALTKSVDYLLLERNHIAPAALGESKWQVIGEGLYRDDFIGPLYGLPAGTIISVEVAQHIEDKNRYRIIEPYSRDAVIDILGGTPDDMIFTTPGYVEFIVDPTAGTAYIPSSWLGFKLDVGTGNGPEDFYLASVYADETTLVYGKYEVDTGMISFHQPQSIMWHIPDGRGNYTNFSGLFAVALKAVTNTWSVVGSFNNWGEAPEIDMTYDEANNIFYATGVEFEADTEFKLRNNWNDSYGSLYYSYIDANSFKTALSDGENIRVKYAGTYDIYFSEDDLLIWLMESGEDRATAVEDLPDGWDGETTSEIRYTSNDGNVITPNNVQAFGIEILSNEYVNGEGVITFAGELTTIGDSAFNNCSNLTSITIPNSVTTIGESAFGVCKSLTSVTIPDSVTTIGDNAFDSCTSLTSVTIGNSVTTIGRSAFNSCYRLTSITIPDSVTTIGHQAFWNCESLTSVTIGDSVTTIGDYAFSDCNSLTSVTIGDSVTTIGYAAFFACSNLTSVVIPDSVTTIGDYAFHYCPSLTSVTIGDSVTTIGEYAFSYCDSLTSVTIGDSVTTIGWGAFAKCSSLTSVYCEATTPPHIDGDVFDENSTDRKIYVYEECVEIYKAAWSGYADSIVAGGNIPESVTTTILYTTSDGAIIDASKFLVKSHTYNNGVGELILYGELKTIPYGAFSDCYSLTSVTIPDSVTSIGDYAFYWCSSLTSVTIPDSVTTIGEYAFRNCESLTSVTIPDSVTTIGGSAFRECRSLTSVTIPDSVTTIGNYAFYSCESLTSVTIPDSVTTIGMDAFSRCRSLTSVTIGDSVTTIGVRAFSDCDSLTNVTIPDSVTTIGVCAFQYCDSLTSVTIPNSVTTIGEAAFDNCSSLAEFKGKFAADGGRCLIIDGVLNAFALGCGVTEYTIPDSVTTIGNSAFYCCRSLTSVTIGDSVTTIGEYAFSYCDSLTSVTIGDSVTTIGNWAFGGCSSLTSVTIPDSVTTIGRNAFENCSSLAEFKGKFAADGGRCLIIDGVLNAFALGCGVTEYTIPDSVTSIGNSAFKNCSSLTSVTIPDSITTIGHGAFYYCGSLTSVYCKATTPPTLNGNGFHDNADGRKIYVPAESVEAYKTADENWSEYAADIVGYDFE